MQCAECRFDNPDDSRFCQSCGVPLTRRCVACGHGNVPDARFCGGCGAALDAAEPPSPEPAAPEAERRQLTVLFCDLVGSTALSARLDPEDMRDVLRAYQDACSGAIARYDGFVAKFMGDGVFSYFGYPTAHEDDAERAIQAGLGIISAIGALDHNLAVRIGIATGTVAVGDIVGEGASEEAAIVGEAPNLAARLQEIAEPDTVIIGEATHVLAGRMFETSDLGRRELKGFADPVGAWAVHRPHPATSRFEVIHGERLSELVGREEEVNVLRRRWERSMAGEGQVVLISGEPGIGKSRLAHTIRQHVADDDTYYRTFQCSPHHTNSAMFPFIEQVRHNIGLTAEETNDESLAKLEAWIGAADQAPEEIAPVFGPALGIDTSARWPVPTVSPQRQKEILLEAFSRRLKNLAARQPVLYLVEDAHWIDPTSLELLGLHIERTRGVDRVLFVITFRPEFEAPWVGQPHTTLLALNRLERSQCAALAASVGGEQPLSEAVIRQIADRTDGVPLFVEELTKAIVESGRQTDGQESPLAAVPATLQDALEARLDRLGAARDLAQIGAVIGRSFDYSLLHHVAAVDEPDLTGMLDQLVRSGLVTARGEPPEAIYTFKHALVQDTAYGTLLRTRRAELHARIAQSIESVFPDKADSQPEVLAHHFTESGAILRAVPYLREAGKRALGRSAGIEAVTHLEQALDLVRTLPKTPEHAQLEYDLLMTLSPAVYMTQGMAADELGTVNERAFELASATGNRDQSFRALFGLWMYHLFRPPVASAKQVAEQLDEIAHETGDSSHRLQAHHALWTTAFFLGDFTTAHHYMHEGSRIYDITEHGDHAYIYGGHDPGSCALNFDSMCLWLLGYPDQSIQTSEMSAAHNEEVGHKVSIAVAFAFAAICNMFNGSMDAARTNAVRALELARDHGFAFGESFLLIKELAETAMRKGQSAEPHLVEICRHPDPAGMEVFRPYLLSFLASLQAEAGLMADALTLIQEAFESIASFESHWCEAELHRQKGELLRANDSDTTEVEYCFNTGLAISREQDARSWELRTTTSLARLWRSHGKTTEARDLLAPIYGWFTEGFDTADLKDAKALLDEMG